MSKILSDLAKKLNISIDQENGVIIPDLKKSDFVRQKISLSFDEIIKKISAVKPKKIIIYLPGSYDVVHIGHASYIYQVIKATKLKEKEIFTLLLADSDSLIRKTKAYKYIGNGGTEPKRRPVENSSERLLSLAYTKADLIGLISENFGDIEKQQKMFDQKTIKNY